MKMQTFTLIGLLAAVAPCRGQSLQWSIWPTVQSDVLEVRLGASKNSWELYVAPRHDRNLDRYEVTVTDVAIHGWSDVRVDTETEADIDVITDIRAYLIYRVFSISEIATLLGYDGTSLPEGDVYAGAYPGWACGRGEWEAGGLIGCRIELNDRLSWSLEYQQSWDTFDDKDDRYAVVTGVQFVF